MTVDTAHVRKLVAGVRNCTESDASLFEELSNEALDILLAAADNIDCLTKGHTLMANQPVEFGSVGWDTGFDDRPAVRRGALQVTAALLGEILGLPKDTRIVGVEHPGDLYWHFIVESPVMPIALDDGSVPVVSLEYAMRVVHPTRFTKAVGVVSACWTHDPAHGWATGWGRFGGDDLAALAAQTDDLSTPLPVGFA
jgi:hypothetical protein